MRRVVIIALIVFLSILSQSFAQSWVRDSKYVEISNSDTLLAKLTKVMKNEIGLKRPDLMFRELDKDSSLTLDHFRGYTLILNFWGTHCGACRMQIPELSKIQKQFKDKGLLVIYLSNGDVTGQKEFFNKYLIEGIKANMAKKDVESLKSPYQFVMEPTAYIIDKSGVVRDAWVTPEDYNAIKNRILPYIEITQ